MNSAARDEILVEYDRFQLIDFGRFIASFLVLFGHARNLIFDDYNGELSVPWKIFYFVTGFGHQAVIFFFVLSGYWISQAVARRIDRKDFWQVYLAGRLARLWIVLVPAVATGVIFDLIGDEILHGGIYHGTPEVTSLITPINVSFRTIFGNLLFLQAIVVVPVGTNGPLWSLAYEFWYYIWFPALFLIRKGRLSPWLFTLFFAFLSPQILIGFLCWLGGAAAYFLTTSNVTRRWANWCLGVGTVLVVAALMLARLYPDFAFSDLLLAISEAIALWGWVSTARRKRRWLVPLASFGARGSFSLYATHFPLITLLVASSVNARLAPTTLALSLLAAVMGVAIAFACLFANVTEKKTPEFRRVLGAAARFLRGGDSEATIRRSRGDQ